MSTLPWLKERDIAILGSDHPQGVNPAPDESNVAPNAVHDFTERDVINVAVDEPRAWLTMQRLAIEALHRFIVSGPTLAQIEIGSKARHVRQ